MNCDKITNTITLATSLSPMPMNDDAIFQIQIEFKLMLSHEWLYFENSKSITLMKAMIGMCNSVS